MEIQFPNASEFGRFPCRFIEKLSIRFQFLKVVNNIRKGPKSVQLKVNKNNRFRKRSEI